MIFDWMNYITILALSIVCVGLGVAMDDWMKPGKIFSFLRFWTFWVTKGDMLFYNALKNNDVDYETWANGINDVYWRHAKKSFLMMGMLCVSCITYRIVLLAVLLHTFYVSECDWALKNYLIEGGKTLIFSTGLSYYILRLLP